GGGGADDARGGRFSRGGRFHVLWTEPRAFVPPRRRLRRQDSARGEAGRPAGRAAHQVRSRRQPHDCQGARPGDTDHSTRSRRRGNRVKRRDFIPLIGVAAATWPLAARAQQATKLSTIGYLGLGTLATESQRMAAFVQRLRELGWIEGRTVAIDYRWADGHRELMAEIAAEFVRLKVDVIFAGGTEPALAAKKASALIPIVFPVASDPVGAGMVASLARPGGNVTGLSVQAVDLAGKRLEILRDVFSRLDRLAIMGNVGGPGAALEMHEFQEAARTL